MTMSMYGAMYYNPNQMPQQQHNQSPPLPPSFQYIMVPQSQGQSQSNQNSQIQSLNISQSQQRQQQTPPNYDKAFKI
jgi:hypothetical protein